MKSPIRHILPQLLRRELQPTDEKDEGHGAIQNTIFRPNGPSMTSNPYKPRQSALNSRTCRGQIMLVWFSKLTREIISQDASYTKPNDEILREYEIRHLLHISPGCGAVAVRLIFRIGFCHGRHPSRNPIAKGSVMVQDGVLVVNHVLVTILAKLRSWQSR